MSGACLRKLNRDRENDSKNKLIRGYKNLLKISINLSSRSNMGSLIFEAEKRLKEFLKIENALVIVIDHD